MKFDPLLFLQLLSPFICSFVADDTTSESLLLAISFRIFVPSVLYQMNDRRDTDRRTVSNDEASDPMEIRAIRHNGIIRQTHLEAFPIHTNPSLSRRQFICARFVYITSNLRFAGGLDQGSYNQGQGPVPLDPYNQEAGDPYGRSRGYDDNYGGGEQSSRDSYGDGYRGSYGSRDDYGREDPGGQQRGGYPQHGQHGGYGAAGDSENYPSSYTVVPAPGYAGKCNGSACCVPKCFAEKGSRVNICWIIRFSLNLSSISI